ncbi:glycine--tRNA ligase subunit beta [Gracilibacillus salitolerans]|uniref:Glycine--tRNA ligase beta subunit n=1 Tax=Gracilibacillus salitolerans TaxID=2663022 RepID=A0A5Q2TM71_9BACI|nr:glycine--tRNA ligase subunit beta [Gracilibacillus salitolerans]QGH34960.1 glycine--tRNA ligase subunit beta [Gracilibacillus salitolerans]
MKTTNVLFEVGLEEMPARFMNDTEKQLKSKTIDWLKDIRLAYQNLTTYITPRRFAVLIEGLDYKQADQEEEAKGPALKIAKDDDGNWTKAAIGFSKGQGKSIDDLYLKEVNGTEYVFVNKFLEGKTQEELLSDFKDIILGLNFPKNMRWADQNLRYIRPIKWLVALQDEKVIPFEIAGVHTSNKSFGHRFLGGRIEINTPSSYAQLLNDQYVIAETKKRQEMIFNGIRQLEQEKGWKIPIDGDLLTEVTHLVEYPTVFFGHFSEEFLHIPKEVLITSMKEHQRYFPVQTENNQLLPYFIGVRNGTSDHIDTVSRGNEKVLRARLQDAQFFYDEDQKQSIDNNLTQLDRMVFQESLGTIGDKVKRVTEISEIIATELDLSEQEKTQIERAARISKFDLVTNMVNEFTELQGIMGRKYATIFGEEDVVAQAIEEHYMPRNANDELPASIVGSVVSIADKIDTIVGCFAVGLIPSGSQDPYALRRQALGILQINQHNSWDLNINQLIEKVFALFDAKDISKAAEKSHVLNHLESFFKQRAAYIMKEAGIEADIIDAVLVNELSDFSLLLDKAQLLKEKRADSIFKDKQEAFVRVMNLATKAEGNKTIEPSLFEKNEENKLYQTYIDIKDHYQNAIAKKDAKAALDQLTPLVEPIHHFFDNTMVMADDEKIRDNRLALLKVIASEINKFADLTKVQWKQTQVVKD